MRRWQTAVGLVILSLCMAAGCSQSVFISEATYDELHRLNSLPPDLEVNPRVADAPPIEPQLPPGTVNKLEFLKPRYISLQEAIAVALQQGMIGSQSVRFPGVTEDLINFGGPVTGAVGSDAIRVLSLNPAIIGANIDRELARFDALWTTTMNWTNTDEPVQGLASFTNGMAGSLISTIAKPLATGGVAGITFENDYRLLARPPVGAFSVLNPSYTSKLSFGFEQPLLRFGGIDINQILGAYPGSLLFPNLNGLPGTGGRRATGEGILLARIRFDQQRADFQRSVNFQLLNVESAYWNLYNAYVALFSTEQAMRMAYLSWRIGAESYKVGKVGRDTEAALRAQYQQFRATRVTNVGTVLDNERLLRILMGMKVGGDNVRLVPCDAPTLAPYLPDWTSALQDCLNLRPELLVAREDLRTRQFNLIATQQLLKPDLRFTSTYTAVGLGTSLQGNAQYLDSTATYRSSNSWRSLASDHFNDWSMGLNLNVPLGYRYEHGSVRQAKLQLAQAYAVLKEQEIKAQNFLAKTYRLVQEYHKTMEVRRQEREAWADRLDVYLTQWRLGRIVPGGNATIDLLDAMRQWTTALTNEYTAIVNYNVALAQFEFAKGTIMDYDNVTLAEGPIPQCAVAPAREHERERSHALVLRERESAMTRLMRQPPAGIPNLPIVPTHEVPTLPALEQSAEALPDPVGLGEALAKIAPGASAAVGQPVTRVADVTAPMRAASLSAPIKPAGPDHLPPATPPARLEAVIAEDPEIRHAPQSAAPVRLGQPVSGLGSIR